MSYPIGPPPSATDYDGGYPSPFLHRPSQQAGATHLQQEQQPRPLQDPLSDPTRLLAVYPLAAPYTPSTDVAQHVASLTVASPHPSAVLPLWHGRPEFAAQRAVLARGPMNEAELRWYHEQLESVGSMLQHGSANEPYQHPPQLYPYQLPHGHFAATLLQSQRLPAWAFDNPYPPPQPSSIYPASDSQRFLNGFISGTLAAIPTIPDPKALNPVSSPASSHVSFSGQATPSRSPSVNSSLAARIQDQQIYDTPPRQPEFVGHYNSTTLYLPSTAPWQDGAHAPPPTGFAHSPGFLKRKSPDGYDALTAAPYSDDYFSTPRRPEAPAPALATFAPAPDTGSRTPQNRSPALQAFHSNSSTLTPLNSSQSSTAVTAAYAQATQLSGRTSSSAICSSSAEYQGEIGGEIESASGTQSPKEKHVKPQEIPGSTRKTPGTRDEKDAGGKLRDLFEDIFEALDTLPHPLPPDYLLSLETPHSFFSRLSSSDVLPHPLLSASTLRRIARLLAAVGKRSASSSSFSAAAATWCSEADAERMLSLLRRSLEEGREIGQFWAAGGSGKAPRAMSSPKKSPAKGRVTRSRSRSVQPEGENKSDDQLEASLGQLLGMSEVALEAGLAIDCCLLMLTGKTLPKQLYSEQLIGLCLGIIKEHLAMIIYPYLDGLVDPTDVIYMTLSYILTDPTSRSSQRCTSTLSEVFQSTISILPHLRDLVNLTDIAMSDDLVNQAVGIAIGPFFAADLPASGKGRTLKGKEAEAALTAVGGKSGLRALRLDALGLLRALFGRYEDQRSWIIQEVLLSLIKLPDIKKSQKQFQLRDGRSIHIVSALLLQLIQTCTNGARQEVESKRTKTRSRTIIDKQRGTAEEVHYEDGKDEEKRPPISEVDLERQEVQVYTTGLDAAAKSARSIASFLMQSSASGKAAKTSEADYRAVLDIFLSDLIVVLYWPEWPAAALLLGWFCKLMMTSLNEEKSSAEDNAAKTIALDYLGVIAARIRSSLIRTKARIKKEAGDDQARGPFALAELVARLDAQRLRVLISQQNELLSYLGSTATTDLSFSSTYEYSSTLWGQELSTELAKLSSNPSVEGAAGGSINAAATQEVAFLLRAALQSLWTSIATHDVFGSGQPNQIDRMDALSEEINCSRALGRVFDSVLGAILCALDLSSATLRARALRALGQVVADDATVLEQSNVQRTIQNHMSDTSPAVRDAAVELIGRHLIQQPQVIDKYYAKISERVGDSSLAVRKRAIKLLKTIYNSLVQTPRRADIAVKLLSRWEDEDEGVKDLAVHTLEELWFTDGSDASTDVIRQEGALAAGNTRSSILDQAAVIAAVAGHFRERQSPLEMYLRQIVDAHSKAKDNMASAAILLRYRQLSDALIDSLIDANDTPGFSVAHCIKALYHLNVACPESLSSGKAGTLLPYLRPPTNSEEQAISSYLLKIFRSCVVKMPKTASTFARNLEKTLLPMVNGAAGGAAGLQDSIACLCAVVNNLTQSYDRLVKILATVTGKLEAVRNEYENNGRLPMEDAQKKIALMLYIAALFAEHCDFEDVRSINHALATELSHITKRAMPEYIFDLLCAFRIMPAIPAVTRAAFQALGFLYRAYPTLMLHEASLKFMDEVLEAEDLVTRAILLEIIQDFLISQSLKIGDEKKDAPVDLDEDSDVDMTELIGDTEGFAESGVSSTIVQRYLMQILDAALHTETQHIAMEILTFTIKQGLAHPIQSAPIIIALETNADVAIAARAFQLHSILHHKHASIINSRFNETARICYEYQKKTSSAVRGFRLNIVPTSVEPIPAASLYQWYSLIREKRPLRRDFLKYFVRALDVDVTSSSPPNTFCSEEDIGFSRYLADNLATFDYKTQEEVLVVLDRLNASISVSGGQLYDIVTSMRILPDDRGKPANDETLQIKVGIRGRAISVDPEDEVSLPETIPNEEEDRPPQSFNAAHLGNLSVIFSLVFTLKAHLQALYGLNDEKIKKFSLTAKKSALGDKVATRKTFASRCLNLDSIPHALIPVNTVGDLETQANAFIVLAERDGTALDTGDDD